MIQGAAGTLAALLGVVGLFFFLERWSGWRLFRYLPPLIWIYTLPVLLGNAGVIAQSGPLYDALKEYALPIFIVLMLLQIDVVAVVRVIGRGMLVMLVGSLGVVVGAPIAYLVVGRFLGPEGWKGFGALAGSWIGGTGNMAAIAAGIGTPPAEMGLAVLADNAVYIVWLPILLASRAWAGRFQRFSGADPERTRRMEAALEAIRPAESPMAMRHVVYLALIGLCVALLAGRLAPLMPEIGPVLTASTWKILLVTTIGVLLSLTPARRIPGSHALAMAIVYLFVASMGARAELAGLARAPWFLAGAFLWISVHGLFCLLGARLLLVDI
ncbi:MAG: DUF819 family protein, partial [Candidatus Eisenbacteria bacterium]|nr:DUF819 family protein [Candidatus Eisenbacteria bacterium]